MILEYYSFIVLIYPYFVVLKGAGHGTELVFLFGPTLIQSAISRRFNSAEERLSIAMKRIWAEFIRQGYEKGSK